MRRNALYASIVFAPLLTTGCTGFGTFLDHTFSLPGNNPNIPMTDSENIRRVLGQNPDPTPLQPEPGNVWPGPQGPDPTLADLQGNPAGDQRGFPNTAVPGAEPGLPAGRQPRPQGSSSPPGNARSGYNPPASVPPRAQPGQPSSGRGGNSLGQVIQTPNGPAVDAGGTSSYRQLTTPQGPGAIIVPNGNGTSTIINPNGTVQTIRRPADGTASLLRLGEGADGPRRGSAPAAARRVHRR